MRNLECNSLADLRQRQSFRIRHFPGETLPRHRHRETFAAIVLGGSYVEAGDTGRHRVHAGDVIVHRCFEGHLDRVEGSGAEVLVLPLAADQSAPIHGRVDDPDLITRLAERDVRQAGLALLEQVESRAPSAADWPDALAQAILADPDISITDWAEAHRLHPGSVSRGFRQQFELSPASFRVEVRAQRAMRSLVGTNVPLGIIAVEAGFADQPHMSRVLKAITGSTPKALRLHYRTELWGIGGTQSPYKIHVGDSSMFRTSAVLARGGHSHGGDFTRQNDNPVSSASSRKQISAFHHNHDNMGAKHSHKQALSDVRSGSKPDT